MAVFSSLPVTVPDANPAEPVAAQLIYELFADPGNATIRLILADRLEETLQQPDLLELVQLLRRSGYWVIRGDRLRWILSSKRAVHVCYRLYTPGATKWPNVCSKCTVVVQHGSLIARPKTRWQWWCHWCYQDAVQHLKNRKKPHAATPPAAGTAPQSTAADLYSTGHPNVDGTGL